MKRLITICLLLLTHASFLHAQTDTAAFYQRKSYMIPMRDVVKLFTVVMSPVNFPKPVPILLTRTPYGADIDIKEDSSVATDLFPSYYKNMLKEGYILVFQDMRGKFKSEGTFEMTRPLYHLQDPKKTDESTDASDAVGWLVKNVPGNNGKAGIFGISYLGYTALDATCDPNPALKASSPQASPCDMFFTKGNVVVDQLLDHVNLPLGGTTPTYPSTVYSSDQGYIGAICDFVYVPVN